MTISWPRWLLAMACSMVLIWVLRDNYWPNVNFWHGFGIASVTYAVVAPIRIDRR